jgi:hypothetical protein
MIDPVVLSPRNMQQAAQKLSSSIVACGCAATALSRASRRTAESLTLSNL